MCVCVCVFVLHAACGKFYLTVWLEITYLQFTPIVMACRMVFQPAIYLWNNTLVRVHLSICHSARTFLIPIVNRHRKYRSRHTWTYCKHYFDRFYSLRRAFKSNAHREYTYDMKEPMPEYMLIARTEKAVEWDASHIISVLWTYEGAQSMIRICIENHSQITINWIQNKRNASRLPM